MTNQTERAFEWDDEIEKSGGEFTLLPEGDYDFEVTKFERARHPGSANLPACNMAVLTLSIDGGQHGNTSVRHRLFLHSKTEGFLSNFFEAIGQKKEGERVRMNWNAVHGAKGRCKLEINSFTGNDGQEKQNNQVKTFLPYDPSRQQQQGGYQQQVPQQQQYQQPPAQQTQQANYQAPFPTGGQQQQGGFTPGNF